MPTRAGPRAPDDSSAADAHISAWPASCLVPPMQTRLTQLLLAALCASACACTSVDAPAEAPAAAEVGSPPPSGSCATVFRHCVPPEALGRYFQARDGGAQDAAADASDAGGPRCPSAAEYNYPCSAPGCPHFAAPDAAPPFDVGVCRKPVRDLPSRDGLCCYEVESYLSCPHQCG